MADTKINGPMPDQELANLPGSTKLTKTQLPKKPPSSKTMAKKSAGKYGMNK